jgi:hypothetical protein
MRRIKAVEAKANYCLVVSWERGQPIVVDLSDMVRKGGVFARLADMNVFAGVRIGDNNRVVEWPEPKDDLGHPIVSIDAESLYDRYREQQDARKVSILDGMMKDLRSARMQTSQSGL